MTPPREPEPKPRPRLREPGESVCHEYIPAAYWLNGRPYNRFWSHCNCPLKLVLDVHAPGRASATYVSKHGFRFHVFLCGCEAGLSAGVIDPLDPANHVGYDADGDKPWPLPFKPVRESVFKPSDLLASSEAAPASGPPAVGRGGGADGGRA